MTELMPTVSGNVQNARTRIQRHIFFGVLDTLTTEKAWTLKIILICAHTSKKSSLKDAMKRNSEKIIGSLGYQAALDSLLSSRVEGEELSPTVGVVICGNGWASDGYQVWTILTFVLS